MRYMVARTMVVRDKTEYLLIQLGRRDNIFNQTPTCIAPSPIPKVTTTPIIQSVVRRAALDTSSLVARDGNTPCICPTS